MFFSFTSRNHWFEITWVRWSVHPLMMELFFFLLTKRLTCRFMKGYQDSSTYLRSKEVLHDCIFLRQAEKSIQPVFLFFWNYVRAHSSLSSYFSVESTNLKLGQMGLWPFVDLDMLSRGLCFSWHQPLFLLQEILTEHETAMSEGVLPEMTIHTSSIYLQCTEKHAAI